MQNRIKTSIELCELKFAGSKDGTFEGYASVFDGNDSYGDTIEVGAFKKTIKNDRTPSMFINHDSNQIPVGDWKSLEEDSTGLSVVGKVDLNHKDGPSLYSALSRKAMDGISIGFTIPKGGFTYKEDQDDIPEFMRGRILTEITLKEMSVVNFPADDSARISAVKSEIQEIPDLKTAERFLRDLGLSKAVAMAFVSHVKNLYQSDSAIKDNDKITQLEKQVESDVIQSRLVDFINNL